MRDNEKYLDAIRGCLIGGAAGDALGYPVEFMTLDEIYRQYPETGIAEYHLDNELGKGIISDDTQMTLFTAKGILTGVTRAHLRGIAAPIESYIYQSYIDWLTTQTGQIYDERQECCPNWLNKIKELNETRAPGNSCISTLQCGNMGTIEKPINNSKGCGGVMRVAPIALYSKEKFNPLIGAKSAAITHGHPLGYMPAEALTYIIHRIVYGSGTPLYDIVSECCDMLKEVFEKNIFTDELIDILELAVCLSLNGEDDTDNIVRIGKGWVAEEALGIALYCSLKYYDDFSAAIIAAVNHDGDSDSTGAITGNIVGAHIGYENIPAKWKQNLQLHDLIVEVADDLCHGCQMDDSGDCQDDEWFEKYGG